MPGVGMHGLERLLLFLLLTRGHGVTAVRRGPNVLGQHVGSEYVPTVLESTGRPGQLSGALRLRGSLSCRLSQGQYRISTVMPAG